MVIIGSRRKKKSKSISEKKHSGSVVSAMRGDYHRKDHHLQGKVRKKRKLLKLKKKVLKQ